MANMEKTINDVPNKINGAAKDTQKAVQRGVDSMGEMKQFLQDEGPEYLRHAMADIQDSAQKALDVSKSTVKKYPLYSIVGAVAAGAVLGMFLGRSRK